MKCGNIYLSKRDAPSLHLDFFHTRNEHTARFLNILFFYKCESNFGKIKLRLLRFTLFYFKNRNRIFEILRKKLLN